MDAAAAPAGEPVSEEALGEVVADMGYHSNEVVKAHYGPGRGRYIAEPDRSQRDWEGKTAERDPVYANRRRMSERAAADAATRGTDRKELRPRL